MKKGTEYGYGKSDGIHKLERKDDVLVPRTPKRRRRRTISPTYPPGVWVPQPQGFKCIDLESRLRQFLHQGAK